jgi:single-stranded DNA-binding protein
MFINGLPDCNREGVQQKTGLICGRAAKDGQIYATQSGKEVGSVSVPAYDKQDGTTAWLTVKGWGHWARLLANVRKGDSVFAVGRVESHDYEGKTYNDLVADYVCVSASTAGQAPAQSAYAAPAPTDNFAEIEDDGELPF